MRTTYVKERAGQMRARFMRRGAIILHRPVLMKMLECGIRFFLGGILSGAEIFGGYAPFGLGFVAASGVGLEGLSALFGVALGSMVFMGFTQGLKYVAAAILIFSVAFAFYDTKIYKKVAFMPVIAAAMTLCTGFVYLSESGWFTAQTIFFGTEVLLTGGTAYFYRIALSPGSMDQEQSHELRQTVSMLILIMGALIALSGVTLLANISLGRLVATLAVMIAAYRGGIGMGSATGISAGLAMDISCGGIPFFSMAYAFAGLTTGVFFRQGKLFCAVSYVMASALAVLWTWEGGMGTAILYETFVASIIFMILPDSLFHKWDVLFQSDEKEERLASRAREFAKQRLEKSAAAFHDVYEAINFTFAAPHSNDNDISVVFDRTATKICRKCALSSVCWEKDYVTTFNALNDAAPKMLDRGRGEPNDFPKHFSSRCLYFSRFLSMANEELTALLYRQQYNNRLRESRSAVCRQYAELSGILRETAVEMGADMGFEPQAEKRLQMQIKSMGIQAKSMVFTDSNGRMHAEIEGEKISTLLEGIDALSEAIGIPIAEPELQRGKFGERIILLEAEPFLASVGSVFGRKGGENVSGDSGTFFKNEDGTMYLLLSDGMGSGEGAARESSMTVRLLERFLRAGIEPEPALKTLNSALSLRGEEEGSCTTIDLLRLNLFTGEAAIFKYGAAPTYIKKGKRISRITCNAMPAGAIGSAAPPDVTRLRMEAGNFVIVSSDGLADSMNDEWLRSAAAAYDGANPKELAKLLLSEGVAHRNEEDDISIIVLYLRKRPETAASD